MTHEKTRHIERFHDFISGFVELEAEVWLGIETI